MAKCKECRFYESRRCSEMNMSQSPTSIACHRFSQYSTRNPNELKKCKDCRFYETGVEYYPDGTKDVCRLLKRQMLEDGFCSVGERRTDVLPVR